ncbi:MAG: thiosulfohydrolase SoxB [Steroidobacteraceae bacterium]
MDRREFLAALGAAYAAGLWSKGAGAQVSYDLPRFGNVSLLHITDSHGQLLPIHYREPDTNLGIGPQFGQPPHLVGSAFLKHFGIAAGSAEAFAFTPMGYVDAAAQYGRMGGYAHLATLVKQLRASRPGALLLDGGDAWQGSGTALWTRGLDMAEAGVELGVDVMTGHWEFTLGAERVQELVEGPLAGRTAFIAQNIASADFGDPIFEASVLREINGVPIGIIGQAFPYTPIANPRHFTPEWTFGLQERGLQSEIDRLRAAGAQVVVILSHNGMDVDLKLASRLTGLDAILGGHTHDAMPRPTVVSGPSGPVLVTNAGSNGKFVGVLDFDVREGRIRDYQYRLLPVFSSALPADTAMAALIERHRAPYLEQLAEPLARTDTLLYRRGNFNGSFDQLILDALMQEKEAEIAFSPGFRWGTSVLPGEVIRMEDLLGQTAITYPAVTLTEMTGERIKAVLEDVCDNLFNPDPFYQQGGDMVRVGGLRYRCTPGAAMGQRIDNLTLAGKPLDASRSYKVAGWASVAEGVSGEPVWDLVARYLRGQKTIGSVATNVPELVGVGDNPGRIDG